MNSHFYPAIREAAISGLMAFMQQRDYTGNLNGIGFLALAAPLLLTAIIFLALGLYFGLAPVYGQGISFALTGGILLALALGCLYAGNRMLRQRRAARPLYTREELAVLIDGVSDDLEGEIAAAARENPKTAVAAAVLAGFMAGKGVFANR